MTPEEAEKEIAALDGLTARQLRAKWGELFGTYCYTGGTQFLIRRITWKLRNAAQGGLSKRARNRAAALHNEGSITFQQRSPRGHAVCDKRTTASTTPPKQEQNIQPRIRREYKGKLIEVSVLGKNKFAYNGKIYTNLTAISWEVTGYQVSGNRFFNLPSTPRVKL